MPRIDALCGIVGKSQAAFSEHLNLFEQLMKLDRDQTLRAFPGFVKRFLPGCEDVKQVDHLFKECKRALGTSIGPDAISATSRPHASKIVLASGPVDIVWWLNVRPCRCCAASTRVSVSCVA